MRTTRFDDERDSTACRGCNCDYLEVASDGRDLCPSCRHVAEQQAEIERLKNQIAGQAKCLVGHPHLIFKPEGDDA